MTTQLSPLDAALAFVRAMPDEFRHELCMQLVWLEPKDWPEIQSSVLGGTKVDHEALFFSRFDPSSIADTHKEGVALKLRAFITYLIEYAASDYLEELQQNLYEAAKMGGLKDAEMTHAYRRRSREFYRGLLLAWRALCDAEISDTAIGAFGREVWLERQHNY